MHKINLTGVLSISSELMSRLQKRGLLSSSGGCTDNFVLYIQECLARDDMRFPIQIEPCAPAVVSQQNEKPLAEPEVVPKPSSVQNETISLEKNTVPPKKDGSNGISSLLGESDLADLQSSMSTLYRGGVK